MWALGLLFLASRELAQSPDLATGLVGGQICGLFCCYQFRYKKLMIANFQHANANRVQSKVHNKIVKSSMQVARTKSSSTHSCTWTAQNTLKLYYSTSMAVRPQSMNSILCIIHSSLLYQENTIHWKYVMTIFVL
jgi:hypothetical protein